MNEAEAENTDKEGDFNLKVSRRLKVLVLFFIFYLLLFAPWILEKLFAKREKKRLKALTISFLSAILFSFLLFLNDDA